MAEQQKSYILEGDALRLLKEIPDNTFQCSITSPPYWGLRDYGMEGEIGKEMGVEEYIKNLVSILSEVKRTLKPDGLFWLNIGDSYTSGGRKWRAPDRKNPARQMKHRPPTPDGLKEKELVGVPWKVAFALQQDGWYLRSDIIWYKPNCMPESVTDRPTKAHEYVFLLAKSPDYYYDRDAIKEIGNGCHQRNRRTVWQIKTEAFNGGHFATFPPELVEICLNASTREGDFVLDPFFGSGTVGVVAGKQKRTFVGIELNHDYVGLAVKRLKDEKVKVRVYDSWSETNE